MYSRLLVLALLLASGSIVQPIADASLEDRCEAAAVVVRRQVERENIFETLPPQFTVGQPSGFRILTGWGRGGPSVGVVRRFEEAGQRSAFECSNVAEDLRHRGVKLSNQPDTLLEHGDTAIRVGVPAISDARKEALVFVSTRKHGLGGGDILFYLTKSPEGVWVVSGANLLGMS
jgi:hypothetical protein